MHTVSNLNTQKRTFIILDIAKYCKKKKKKKKKDKETTQKSQNDTFSLMFMSTLNAF